MFFDTHPGNIRYIFWKRHQNVTGHKNSVHYLSALSTFCPFSVMHGLQLLNVHESGERPFCHIRLECNIFQSYFQCGKSGDRERYELLVGHDSKYRRYHRSQNDKKSYAGLYSATRSDSKQVTSSGRKYPVKSGSGIIKLWPFWRNYWQENPDKNLWRIRDSNPWPPACKAGALASWANSPVVVPRGVEPRTSTLSV